MRLAFGFNPSFLAINFTLEIGHGREFFFDKDYRYSPNQVKSLWVEYTLLK